MTKTGSAERMKTKDVVRSGILQVGAKVGELCTCALWIIAEEARAREGGVGGAGSVEEKKVMAAKVIGDLLSLLQAVLPDTDTRLVQAVVEKMYLKESTLQNFVK